MISCGGQAALPICYAIKNKNSDINYIEAVSTISSASAGPATRKNISEYISSTEKAISQLLNIEKVKNNFKYYSRASTNRNENFNSDENRRNYKF